MTTSNAAASEWTMAAPDQPPANGGQALERLVALVESGDLEAAGPLVTDDFVMEWPQSGERFSGREAALAALGAQDDKPEPAGEPRISGGGDTWVLMMPLRYSDAIYHYVGVFELRDGRFQRATEYFGAPFPGKPGRAPYRDADR